METATVVVALERVEEVDLDLLQTENDSSLVVTHNLYSSTPPNAMWTFQRMRAAWLRRADEPNGNGGDGGGGSGSGGGSGPPPGGE